jgi:ElaB/YqjD/DUF883 family membrane-anchored ribosome-binding protein
MDEEIIKDLNDELEGAIDDAHRKLNSVDIEESIDELKTEAELLIRKYPVRSVLIGVAAGFLLGRIFKS